MTNNERLSAPSAARNMEPICAILQPLLPAQGLVLEIASGSGEHITELARQCGPDLVFQPSDPGDAERRSIDAWRIERGVQNVQPAIAIDAAAATWPIANANVVFNINMIHISPWAATIGLMQGASRLLPDDGILFTYGPYKRDGKHTSSGNESFDASLRQRNPEWGIRDVNDIVALAKSNGFTQPEIHQMPANNLSLVFRRQT